ncbi:4622_t:CDS:2 [Cetraspora pellucida]|uniref:4622_t:CDS:1 n=1 Tax=Cetraspora pellucida TaxID=1433469 RepID=A0ACA9LNI7_9GLOM|nr:4622_t:CDS:2 [Cetraspora pellucida]
MLYCVDMIVKINLVHQNDKDKSNLTVVWAISVYPVKSEDCEMEVILFVPANEGERDPNVQSGFVKNEYYSVCGKVVSGTYNGKLRLKMTVTSSTHLTIKRDIGSNRCSLRASLVGIAQDIPKEVDNENAIFKLLVNDYTGHMEIIQEDLYVYAANISYIEVDSAVKKKGSSSSDLTVGDFHSSKCVRIEDVEDEEVNFDYSDSDQVFEHTDKDDECKSGIINKSKKIMHSGRVSKGKEKMVQSAVHNTRSRTEMFKNMNEKE